MDFSLTTLFVATSGTLASSGSTQNLTGGQVGVFNPDYTIASGGTIASQKYIYIAEGRIEQVPGLGSKRSDKIAANKVIDWYKTTAVSSVPTQIQSIANWNLECSEQITFTFVLHSSYIDTGFFNGLTFSTVVETPCCNCGDNPCASVTGAALDAFIDQAVAQLNTLTNGPTYSPDSAGFTQYPILANFLTFSRLGSAATGGNPQLIVTEKPLTVYGNPCDLEAYPWEYDRLWFRSFVMKGPVTTQDFEVTDACDIAATSTVVQRSFYPTGSSAEIAQLEKNFYSYQTNIFKHLYKYNSWNQAFQSYVTPGTFYDLYYIKYYPYDEHLNTWNPGVPQDSTVVLAFPTGTGTAFETLLTTYLGPITDVSGTNPTTTTTTSTTSTSTTSTTTLIP
jgi:hypothetical protein